MVALRKVSLVVVIYICIIVIDCFGSVKAHPKPLKNAAGKLLFHTDNKPEWEDDWNLVAQNALEAALRVEPNKNIAKNVIMFLGDGMGVTTVTAGRIYVGQQQGKPGEETQLAFDKFPHVALAKTYNVDRQTPDSAGTATAYLCGEKARIGVIGVNQKVERGNCSTMSQNNNIDSILHWSMKEGKRTGVVTTTRITHASPAASYAHAADRDFEADHIIPVDGLENPLCEDIASQLVTKNHGINVILGGGRRMFTPNTMADVEYPHAWNGSRLDSRNLIEEWQHTTENRSAAYVWNQTGFEDIDVEKIDYLLGLFEPDHMLYEIDRPNPPNEPTLKEMTDTAIKILRREERGYFLFVEGGRIDHAHHSNNAKRALSELEAFNEAIGHAVNITDESDTLIVVTADHSHAFTMGGYPTRANPILELVDDAAIAEEPAKDNLPFLTLSYANGPSGEFKRTNLTDVDVEADNFRQQSLVWLGSETHGGEDVAIYARGPMSHLFHGVQEQHYIPHVMAYASCVGSYKRHNDCPDSTAPTTPSTPAPTTPSTPAPTTPSTPAPTTAQVGGSQGAPSQFNFKLTGTLIAVAAVFALKASI